MVLSRHIYVGQKQSARAKLCWCRSQALTLANTAIETRHHVCKTSPRSTVRVQKMPLLLEWHPELPTAMTPVDETKVRRSRAQGVTMGLHPS